MSALSSIVGLFSPAKKPSMDAPSPATPARPRQAATRTSSRKKSRTPSALARLEGAEGGASSPRGRLAPKSPLQHEMEADAMQAETDEAADEVAAPAETDSAPATESEDAQKEADAGAQADDDDSDTFTFEAFKGHRWVDDALEIEVQWSDGELTWEPEENLHQDAPEALFQYWADQGGRPLNPRDEGLFRIFAIRKHSRNRQRLLVEWVGYDKGEWTWMARREVEQTAKDLLDEYWAGLKRK